jgi:hypothetical protein
MVRYTNASPAVAAERLAADMRTYLANVERYQSNARVYGVERGKLDVVAGNLRLIRVYQEAVDAAWPYANVLGPRVRAQLQYRIDKIAIETKRLIALVEGT